MVQPFWKKGFIMWKMFFFEKRRKSGKTREICAEADNPCGLELIVREVGQSSTGR